MFAREPEGADLRRRASRALLPRRACDDKRCPHLLRLPSALDLEDFPKADASAYFDLSAALEAAPIDAISLEDAHRHNDLRLLERFPTKTIMLGVVGIARTRIESVDEIRARLEAALGYIDAHRLIAAPDCGLVMLDRARVVAKLNLAAAARLRLKWRHPQEIDLMGLEETFAAPGRFYKGNLHAFEPLDGARIRQPSVPHIGTPV